MTVPSAVRSGSARSAAALLLALALPTALFVGHSTRYGRWLVDDALISFAYARTLSDGGGMAQAPGDPAVEGASNPTWTLLLAVLRTAGLFDRGGSVLGVDDYVVVVKVVAVLLFVATSVVAHLTARAVLGPGPLAALSTGLTGCVLALSPSYVIWSVSGLENPLYGTLVVGLAALLCRAVAADALLDLRTSLGGAGLVLLLAGTRPDGLVYVLAYPLVLLAVTARSRLGRSVASASVHLGAFAVPAGALLLWRDAVFGLWVPNTAVAKGQHVDVAAVPDRLQDLLDAAGGWLVCAAALGLTATLVLGLRQRRAGLTPRAGLVGVVVPFALACSAFCVLNRDWMAEYRFATPAAALGALLLGLVLSRCVASARRPRVRGIVVLVALVVLIGDAWTMAPRSAAFAGRPTVPGCFVADRYGRLTDFYADQLGIRSGTYLVPDIGGVLLTSRLRVVDLAGLTEPTIARLRAAHDDAGIRRYVLQTVRPTFVHLHPPWDAGLREDRRFLRDYRTIVPGADYVRRDAATAAAVHRLRPVAAARVQAATDARSVEPRRSCGSLSLP